MMVKESPIEMSKSVFLKYRADSAIRTWEEKNFELIYRDVFRLN